MENKIKEFCELITKEQLKQLIINKLDCEGNRLQAVAHYHIAKKYTRVDIGTSGKYMVDNTTQEIFGIKAYGVIHKGHKFGILDTINDYFWGDYRPYKKEAIQ
jgi:hypothetical protein